MRLCKALPRAVLKKWLKLPCAKLVIQDFPVKIKGEQLVIGDCSVQSSSLARHIQHCKEIFLFAATLGAGVDRAIQKHSLLRPSMRRCVCTVRPLLLLKRGVTRWTPVCRNK